MEENKTGQTSDFPFRIVAKFQDDTNLFYPGETGMTDLSSQGFVSPLRYIFETFPRIRINRLFTSISSGEIIGLVNRAVSTDTGYQPPNFLSYYSIDCPIEINATDLLQTVLKDQKLNL